MSTCQQKDKKKKCNSHSRENLIGQTNSVQHIL